MRIRESILQPYTKALGITVDEILSKSRKRKLVYTRIIISKKLRENKTFQEIGFILKRHHTSIIHYEKSYDILQNYKDFKMIKQTIEGV